MTTTDVHHKHAADMRRRAEAKVREEQLSPEDFEGLSGREIERLFHELRVQQIQLEMQNEELRRAHAELEATRARYFDLYDLAPVGYLTLSDKGVILEANLTAANFLGVSRCTLTKRHLAPFLYKEDQDAFYLHCKQGGCQNEPYMCEVRMVRQDGTVFWAQMAITGLRQAEGPDLYRIALSNITAQKQMEQALRESERQRHLEQETANAQLEEQAESLASIYKALDSVGLIVCDLIENDALIRIFNSGAEKLFGWRQDEAAGKSITLIYPPELVRIMPTRVKKLSRGEAMQSFDMCLVRKSGERFPAIISVHPFDHREGRFHKVVGICRDISKLKQAQMELESVNEELERRVEQRTRELQETYKQYLHAEKLSAIGKLSASIAHEFNNPLQAILSILKGLKKRAILEEEDKALLDAAIGEGARIKELIRSLQEFNRPSSGQMAPMDVHKSLDALLLLHKNEFKSKRINVQCEYAQGLPRILAVSDQIKQVLLNLLTNAVDACQVPGGVITVSTRLEDADRVAVAIKDSGVGIQPEDMDRIFQPFYTTKPAVKGTGLGLSVSHGIVNNHGGEIRVNSRPGKGATFTIVLPIKGKKDADEGAVVSFRLEDAGLAHDSIRPAGN